MSTREPRNPIRISLSRTTPGRGNGPWTYGLCVSAACLLLLLFLVNTAAVAAPAEASLRAMDVVWDSCRAQVIAIADSEGSGLAANSIVAIDPETGAILRSYTGSVLLGAAAISADCSKLYVAVHDHGIVRRFDVATLQPDLDIPLGNSWDGTPFHAQSIAVLPDAPHSVLITRCHRPCYSGTLEVWDDATVRPVGVEGDAFVYMSRREDSGAWFGVRHGRVVDLQVNADGVRAGNAVVSQTEKLPISAAGSLVADSNGRIFDFNLQSLAGTISRKDLKVSAVAHDGRAILGLYWDVEAGRAVPRLRSISANRFLPERVQQVPFADSPEILRAMGERYVAIAGRAKLVIARNDEFEQAPANPLPMPVQSANGILRLPLVARDLAYDPKRQVLYASVHAEEGSFGNQILSIDPRTASVVGTRFAGSDPGPLSIDDEAAQLYAGLQGAPWITTFDLGEETPAGRTAFPVFLPNETLGYSAVLWYPLKLQALPQSPGSVAVLRIIPPYERSVVVYDNGTPRPRTIQNALFGDTLNPGDAPDTLFSASHSLMSAKFSKIRVLADGVEHLETVPAISGRDGPGVVYAGGKIYSEDGGIWTINPPVLHASFVTNGYPLVDLPGNRIVHVFNDLSTNYTVVSDISTQRVLAAIAVELKTSLMRAAVWAGPNRIAIAAERDVLIVPLDMLPSWPEPDLSVSQVSPGIRRHALPISSLAANPAKGRFLVSTGPTAGSVSNSILEIDPLNGGVVRSAFAGSYPASLSAAAGGDAVFTHLRGAYRVARVRLDNSQRDQDIVVDPRGEGEQYFIWNLAAHPRDPEAVAVSLYQGAVAAYRGGTLLPQTDLNQDHHSDHAARYQLSFNATGDRLYGVSQWTGGNIKRASFSADGIRALNPAYCGRGGYGIEIVESGGFLYTSIGEKIDPELARVVGEFTDSELQPPGINYQNWGRFVLPEPAEGKVYFLTPTRILVFDISTYAKVGELRVSNQWRTWQGFSRAGNTLGILGDENDLYLVEIATIPPLSPPLPSVQPKPPATPGVRTIPVQAIGLTYDSSRNRLLASVSSYAGGNGDLVVSTDLATLQVKREYAVGPKPEALAFDPAHDALYVAFNQLNDKWHYRSSELVRVGLSDNSVSPPFAENNTLEGSYATIILQVLPLAGRPGAVLVRYNTGFAGNVWIYENGVAAEHPLNPDKYCSSMAMGDDPNVAFCYNGNTSNFGLARYRISGTEVTIEKFSDRVINEFRVTIYIHDGLLYASSGHIIDPNTLEQVGELPTRGYFAADEDHFYLLDWQNIRFLYPGAYPVEAFVTLRVVDKRTLQVIRTKEIATDADSVGALVACGEGRVAFASGKHIYIVYPGEVPGLAVPKFPAQGVTNAASFVAGATPGALATVFGTNLSNVTGIVDADRVPLPRELAGVSVTLGGLRVPLLAVANVNGREQINFQVPAELRGLSSAPLVISNGIATSDPVEIPLIEHNPGIFLHDGQQGAILHGEGYAPVTSANPAKRGEVVLIYATGLGSTLPEPPTGAAAADAPLSVGDTPVVEIGGAEAEVLFSGLAPGFVGLHQINVRIPAQAPQGAASMVIRQGERHSEAELAIE